MPEGWTKASADFVNRCIQRRPLSRIGIDDMEEIKAHKWFEGLDFKKLERKGLASPFVPSGKNYKPRVKDKMVLKNKNDLKSYIEFMEASNRFQGYYYDSRMGKKRKKLNRDRNYIYQNARNDDMNELKVYELNDEDFMQDRRDSKRRMSVGINSGRLFKDKNQ